jgi:F-box protein 30
MEWNRWPVYSKERSARVPFSFKNYHAKYGQLDVALALRDQRILNQAMLAPQRTKRALRNQLTQRFPAVPFTRKNVPSFSDSSELSLTEEEDDDPEAPWEAKKHPPGLASSVCKQLFDDRNGQPQAENNVPSDGDSENLSPELHSPVEEESNLKHSQVHMTQESVQANAMPKTFNIPQPPPLLLEELLALDLNHESITKYQAKAKSMYTFLCAQCFRRDEYPWHFQNVHCDIQGGLNGWFEQRCPLAQYGCTFSFHRFKPSRQSSSVVFSPLLESFGVRPMSQHSDFSEDQFMEYKLTRRRLSKEPTPEILTSVSYNSAVHVNGITKPSIYVASSDYFSTLPFEILQHIATFLDGYSLCNLALCSRYLRDVCQSLLPDRGLVVQEWEKIDSPQCKWKITFQVCLLIMQAKHLFEN